MEMILAEHQQQYGGQSVMRYQNWSTLIGRDQLRLCSDWLDLDVADASSLMP